MTAAQDSRASIAHQALSGMTPAQLGAQAQNLISTASTLSQQRGAGALAQAQTILGGAVTALKLTENPRLNPAVDLLEKVSTVASEVESAIRDGQSVPLALAQAAAKVVTPPDGTPREMAQGLYRLAAFASSSVNGEIAGAQGLIAELASTAFSQLAEGQNMNPLDFFKQLAASFVTRLASSSGIDKYIPASLLQSGLDLIFNKVTQEFDALGVLK